MKEKIFNLEKEAEELIKKSQTFEELDSLRIRYLGKKGDLKEILKGMKNLSKEERPIIGQAANAVKEKLLDLINTKFDEIKIKEKEIKLQKEVVDISLPGKKINSGGLHPVTETKHMLIDIFVKMGFDVVDGPEVEKDYYNFTALNTPEDHPARDSHDTFYTDENVVLRSHTSPVQIRYMEKQKPPFRMIAPGKVYRADYDVSHTPMFSQLEGLMVGENISFAHLKGVLTEFVKEVFGDREVRFRPHFFPFTEPSAEMDVQCVNCGGKGCRTCKYSGWLEILGCGMVHPNVLKGVNLSPDKYTGFAFGMGIERIAMLRYNLSDLRTFFENDMRFLNQFK